MALNFPEIIDKFLDNANIGKVVTDVGSGFAFTIPYLLLVGLMTGTSVVPADRIGELTNSVARAKARVAESQTELIPDLDEALALLNEEPLSAEKRKDPEFLYRFARRTINELSAEIEKFDTDIEAARERKDPVERLTAAKRAYSSVNDRLIAQKEIIEENVEALRTLENQLSDAKSFQNNMEVMTNNLVLLLVFSIIFGVMLSQVNRLVFVRGLYDFILIKTKRSPHHPEIVNMIATGQIEKSQHEDLVKSYYRYVEGSINMIAPVLFLGFVFPRFARTRLNIPELAAPIPLVCALIALLLCVSGFVTYKRFREQEGALVAAKGTRGS